MNIGKVRYRGFDAGFGTKEPHWPFILCEVEWKREREIFGNTVSSAKCIFSAVYDEPSIAMNKTIVSGVR